MAATDEFQASMIHLDANKEFKFLRYFNYFILFHVISFICSFVFTFLFRCMYQHLELQTTYFLVGHKLYANLMGKIEPVKKHLEQLGKIYL